MEHVKFIERRVGVDVGYNNSNLHPANGEGRVGMSGIDKNYTFEMVLELAYNMPTKPNIIIKAGPNAKWYIKQFQKDTLEEEINKQRWRDISRSTMYIIDWDL
jgi:hypothetical protein